MKKQSQNKANLRKAKMKLIFYSTKDYENEPRLRAPGKQTQSKPIKPNLKNRKQKTENRRQSIGLRPRFFAGGKLHAEINFSLWPDKKSGWLKKCRVGKTMETKCTISSDVA